MIWHQERHLGPNLGAQSAEEARVPNIGPSEAQAGWISPILVSVKAENLPTVLISAADTTLATTLLMAIRLNGWDVADSLAEENLLATVTELGPDALIIIESSATPDPFDLLGTLRSAGYLLPVIVVAEGDAQDGRSSGITAGGDVCLAHPFSIESVLAHLREFARRAGWGGPEFTAHLQVGDLTLEEDSHEVERAGEPISLTTTEYELLRYLMRTAGRVSSRAQILDRVWEIGFDGKPTVVELYISYLRKKIDTGKDPLLHTVRSAGYMLKTPRK